MHPPNPYCMHPPTPPMQVAPCRYGSLGAPLLTTQVWKLVRSCQPNSMSYIMQPWLGYEPIT